MREIKFRGKRIDNGEWVYGYLVEANMNTSFIVQMNYLGKLLPNDTHKIIPGTAGQYTELKDKHGKEIYKGDMAKIKCEGRKDGKKEWFAIHPIVWTGEKYEVNGWSLFDHCKYGRVEIIGNIHENLELKKWIGK